MTKAELYLPRKLTQQLLHLAQTNPNREVCGLIGANQQGIAQTCYPISNRATTPENRFLLDSSEQIATMKTMRERNETLFAIFHSHPTTPAEPSTTDLEQANYPEAVHLIISLNIKGILELRAYRIVDKQAEEFIVNLIEHAA